MRNQTKHELYTVWSGMKNRCRNPQHSAWKWYGAKGIKVCARWLVFDNFVADMAPRPRGTTLDRIDPDRDYGPDNCRWATHKEQGRNKSDVTILTIGGKDYIARALADLSGLKVDTIINRARMGLSYSEVINPKRIKHSKTQLSGILEANKKAAAATHCKHGHEFTPENTITYNNGRNRRCRKCHYDRVAAYQARMKATAR